MANILAKSDIARIVAEKNELSVKQSEEIVKNVFCIITESLINGVDVNIHQFGNFKVKERAARMGHNPKTKEKIKIPASKAINFSVSKTLKEAVNCKTECCKK
ncbi:MAG: HU family DNA-binding protein [Firmicutes bacterium]|nr:HU family DNA-binding protein [Bacillota bacterium]